MDDRATPEHRPGPGDRANASDASLSASPARPFGAELEPVLRRACNDRLSAISWFRTDWQRGGALTGYATFTDDAGVSRDVVVKLPVPPRERVWLLRLQDADNVVPVVYAHGQELGSYDIAWLVMERLPHGPLGAAWGGSAFDHLVAAAGRFYAAAQRHPIDLPPRDKDWAAIFEQARQHLKRHDLPHEQRWKEAYKKVHRKLPEWLKIWEDRPRDQWCHGDLHLANAMTRQPAPAGPAILLDFALVHAGCWVEDAVYFEHLYWARKARLEGRRLCSLLAHERKKHGLQPEADWPRLAEVKRGLLAMSTPAMLEHDGDPHHVQAALEVLESIVG